LSISPTGFELEPAKRAQRNVKRKSSGVRWLVSLILSRNGADRKCRLDHGFSLLNATKQRAAREKEERAQWKFMPCLRAAPAFLL
jgi:hypothetical protein